MALFAPCHAGQGRTVPKEKILGDSALIAPGFGSEGIVLGEEMVKVAQRFGKSRFRISKPKMVNELFTHVFKVAGPVKIYFDTIYYNEDHKCAACVFRGNVVAVIGFENSRTTTDDVNIQSGADNFIFNYGNRNLKVLTGGMNKIYIYPELGIAVIDDNKNDTIDVYFVFAPGTGNKH
jgi:hypothetical protein